jgi:hypothetical protein
MTRQDIEFGLDSFLPISLDGLGQELSGDVVIRNTVEEAVLADAVGIDSFNIDSHRWWSPSFDATAARTSGLFWDFRRTFSVPRWSA